MRFRETYRDIELYEPGRLPVELDLSDNTNLWGVAPSARALLNALPDPLVTRYPAPFAKSLKEALARQHGVGLENVATGCGSDDLIDSAVRAFCEPRDRVAYPWPTFGVVRTFAKMNAAHAVTVPMNEAFEFSASALVDARAAVNYVCTPNNPTGTTVPKSQIERLDRELDGVLLLDEAYAAYGDADFAQFAAASTRTVSLRTMSKVYGLAGLRVGYVIGPAAVIHEIEKSRGPYKVGGVAEAAAAAVMLNDQEWAQDVIRRTRENRARLAEALAQLPVRPYPSAANFILVRLPEGSTASGTNAALREYGVAVRPFTGLTGVGEALRITIGPWPMMQRFLDALEAVLKKGAGQGALL